MMFELILILFSLLSLALGDVNTAGTGVDNLNNLSALINGSINTLVPTTGGIFNMPGGSFPTVALPRLVAGNISEMASVTLDNDGGSGWLSFGTDPDDYEDWLDHDVVDAYTAYLDSINGFYGQFPKYPSFNDGQNTNNDLAHMYWAFDALQTTMCYYAGRLSEMAVLRTSCLEQTNSTVSTWQAYWQSVPSDITHAGNNDTVIPDLWPDPQMITVAQEVCAL